MACAVTLRCAKFQDDLTRLNTACANLEAAACPDREPEVEVDHMEFSAFVVRDCPSCGDVMKPDIVFFGETFPHDQAALAMQGLEQADEPSS